MKKHMNYLSSKLFFALVLIVLFISMLLSQNRVPVEVTDPSAFNSQFWNPPLEEQFNSKGPPSSPDFQYDRRPWWEKESQIEDDYQRQFEPKIPSPPSIYNMQMLDSVWVNYRKYTYTYDANGNRTEALVQRWGNNAWVNARKITYTYDANGNRTESLGQHWEYNAWVNSSKRTYTYDANGNLTEELGQHWENNAWVNSWKRTYTYDANGNLTEELGQHWENNAWVNGWKYTYTYDAIGNMTEELGQRWENNAWVNSWKDTYTYDANGNRTEWLLQRWENNAWMNSRKYTYTYDANGNRTESLLQRWENNAWVNSYKYTYTYDANGNRTEWLVQRWENNAWVNYIKFTYTYNANGNMTEALYQWWGVPLAVTYGNTLPNAFNLSQNYPNPFNPVTTIRYELPSQSLVTLVIYDLIGHEIRTLVNRTEEPGYRSVTWDARNDAGQPVGAGIYLYRIQAGGYSKTNKMILLK